MNKVISRIYGHGRGWCFSQTDFIDLGLRNSIDSALQRLEQKGIIRRITRGLYEYPRFSSFLNTLLGPDIDKAAHAIARKFKWHVVPNGPTALQILGVSTQVPAQYVYISSGPDKSYDILGITLRLKHQKTQQTVFNHPESALVVQGIQSLGKGNLTGETRKKIKNKFDEKKWNQIVKDTVSVTSWIHDEIKKIKLLP